MGFIVNNYVWFMIGGGVIFMALIGFIAEKTNFGRGEQKVVETKTEPNFNKNEKLLDTINDNAGVTSEEAPATDNLAWDVPQAIPGTPMDTIPEIPVQTISEPTADNITVPDLTIEPVPAVDSGLEPIPTDNEINLDSPIEMQTEEVNSPLETNPVIEPNIEETVLTHEDVETTYEPSVDVEPVLETAEEKTPEIQIEETIQPEADADIPTSDEETMIEAVPKENPVLFTAPLVLDGSQSVVDDIIGANTFDMFTNPEENVTEVAPLPTEITTPELPSIEEVVSTPVESEDDIWNF